MPSPIACAFALGLPREALILKRPCRKCGDMVLAETLESRRLDAHVICFCCWEPPAAKIDPFAGPVRCLKACDVDRKTATRPCTRCREPVAVLSEWSRSSQARPFCPECYGVVTPEAKRAPEPGYPARRSEYVKGGMVVEFK